MAKEEECDGEELTATESMDTKLLLQSGPTIGLHGVSETVEFKNQTVMPVFAASFLPFFPHVQMCMCVRVRP